MKILSLFDGISIAQQALKNIGIIPDIYFASEVDKYAIQITQKNFPNTKRVGEWYEAVRIEQPEDRGILLKDILEGDVDEKYYVKSNNWRIEKNIRDINGKSKCLSATSYKGAQSDGMSLIKTSINKDIPKKTNDNTIKTG